MAAGEPVGSGVAEIGHRNRNLEIETLRDTHRG